MISCVIHGGSLAFCGWSRVSTIVLFQLADSSVYFNVAVHFHRSRNSSIGLVEASCSRQWSYQYFRVLLNSKLVTSLGSNSLSWFTDPPKLILPHLTSTAECTQQSLREWPGSGKSISTTESMSRLHLEVPSSVRSSGTV